MNSFKWSVIAESVTGESHLRKGLPNQDSVASLITRGSGQSVILAVSDGHGSSSCYLSDVGSRIAVGVAVRELEEVSELITDYASGDGDSSYGNAALERYCRKEVARKITNEWRSRVEQHYHRNRDGDAAELHGARLWRIYGATLTTIFISNQMMVVWCLGDGAILVERDGQARQILSLDSEAFIGEDTDSLCLEDAHDKFRVYIETFQQDDAPGLVLVCTDGFSNAFQSSQAFEKSAIDFSKHLGSPNGLGEVEANMEKWLREYSAFSGDDVTVGLVFRTGPKPNDTNMSAADPQEVVEGRDSTRPRTSMDSTIAVDEDTTVEGPQCSDSESGTTVNAKENSMERGESQ